MIKEYLKQNTHLTKALDDCREENDVVSMFEEEVKSVEEPIFVIANYWLKRDIVV